MLSKIQKQLLSIGRQQVQQQHPHFTDEDWRDEIERITQGQTRSLRWGGLTTHHYNQLLLYLRKLGYVPKPKQTGTTQYDHHQHPGHRGEEWSSPEKLDKICVMWKIVTKTPDTWEESLNSFLHKRFGIERREWIKADLADSVIEAIKDMYLREILLSCTKKVLGDGYNTTGNRLLNIYKTLDHHFSKHHLSLLLTVFMTVNPALETHVRAVVENAAAWQFDKLVKSEADNGRETRLAQDEQ